MGVRTDPYNAGITWLDEPLVGSATGPLAGRTLLVKDLVDTAGVRTTYGSKIYADHVPDRHAVVVERALDAGAAVVRPGWAGLWTVPYHSFAPNTPHANSARFAFPTTAAPASSARSTTTA